VWLSIRNVELFVRAIADALIELDPENADMYIANMNAYIAELNELDMQFREVVADSSLNTVVVGDRFPFRYLMVDYGINYYATFPGCHAEAEASFSTIIELAGVLDEYNLHTILVTESSDKSIAETIISSSQAGNQQILVLDSLQSVTTADAAGGLTYLSVMRSNLEVLREALG